jgi:purine nucleoside phosphorylase
MDIKPRVVVIGGSGTIKDNPMLADAPWKTFRTCITSPMFSEWDGVVPYQETDDLVFIPRHGGENGTKRYGPSKTQYLANIVAARMLGSVVIATSAVGSLQEAIEVESLVVPTSWVDESLRNPNLWGTGIITHINPRPAFSPELSRILVEEAGESFNGVHNQGTYVTIPGDLFGTEGEGKKRAHYADIVGQTLNPEGNFALQVGLPYALAAFIVDNDTDANHELGTLEVMERLSTPERVPAFLQRVIERAIPLARDPPTLDQQIKGNIIVDDLKLIPDSGYLRTIAGHIIATYT